VGRINSNGFQSLETGGVGIGIFGGGVRDVVVIGVDAVLHVRHFPEEGLLDELLSLLRHVIGFHHFGESLSSLLLHVHRWGIP